MSQSSYVKSQPDLLTLGGGGGRGNLKLGKHLKWRDRGETWWEKISTSPRYMIE